jgi:hypothetical protein
LVGESDLFGNHVNYSIHALKTLKILW